MSSDTKTLDEFLAENPNVDVSKAWERCWGILSDVKERIAARFPGMEKDPSCTGREYYTSPNKEFEGSFNAWSGPGCEWLVNSWIGNRKASILDMNATAFLGPETDVPHFVMVFGTVPKLFFYFDFTPRTNLLTDPEYLKKYYDEDNQDYIALRGHENFQWAVSHGTYMRALNNPSTQSLSAELTDENIDILEAYAYKALDRWLGWLDRAEPLPQEVRAERQRQDHIMRRLGYELDPMNKLAENVFGKEMIDDLVTTRMGAGQMARSKLY
ncbi:hypothetical protein QGN29_04055 [Temperatibacter marinus]|uniref:Red chlorophyll catabolite reductase n=1 Tax=Temperatibacter marinus TaxID=1456591 RepID=A0AA52HB97_9PROT|nr:hypothetical protein [Temperatibacter marinus]WND03545.1 hypothetical protein QGN29_04055 [Temperatibacter marinus]